MVIPCYALPSNLAPPGNLNLLCFQILKHTHITMLQPFFQDHLGEPVPEEIFWTFMVQGEITEADASTISLGATRSRLSSCPPPSTPIVTLDALPAATVPLYPGLGQAPNMLACIPSGVVKICLPRYWKCLDREMYKITSQKNTVDG